MANTITITKTSGVIFISVDGASARAFFGTVGTYQFASDGLSVTLTVGAYQSSIPPLQVSVPCTGVTVGTSTATNQSSANTLLNAIFGT